ncbi:hypothetical protein E2R68_06040 [Psychromonas sp. RZ22]|uniref:polysaccharide lyase family 7 protein n=1 Tax=Psychromonas algarum TaxID=2555643 RepID=UPI0010674FCA|nr:polysaccharide lyase family 7 protein [Psychromonas sp. RZ22]TEW55312.1 hypothetical protein E2R68_06040 [Psychromonas sp. RZ22]
MKHGKLSLFLTSSIAVALAGCVTTSGPTGPINEKGSEPYLVPVKVVASSNDGNGPDRLIDGDIQTRWSANGPGETATLDYGLVSEFDAVRIAFSKGDERSTNFDIEVSEDGQTWTQVLSGQKSSGRTNTIERFPFTAPVKARYVKYVGQGNSKNSWNSVTEFNAVNCKINTCSALEFINSDSLAALKAAAPTVELERNDNPATSLNNWKLTVPVTNEGLYGAKAKDAAAYYKLQGTKATSAGEILPRGCSLDGSSLSDATSNDYFKVDKAGWHFRTPLDGGTSTPNSTYIRTELRELTTGWKACDATPLANWAYGGTHTLAATLQLNEIPEAPLKKDGKSKSDPKVVLGQIHAHGINAATAKLMWEGANKPVRVILNKTTEKSAFSVKLGKIADPSQPWVYIIKMTDDGIELSAGGVTKKLKFGEELDNAWKKETFYFKAGLYPQVYKAGGGAFDATFKKIHISHVPTAPKIEFLPLPCDSMKCTTNVALTSPKIPAMPKPGNKPYQNIDLTSWYLSIATDADGNKRADNVQEWDLLAGYEHPELFYTAEDGGLVIRSYIKGVRTSTNTKYTRTEMREMLRKGNKAYATKGVNKNNWVFGSAPDADKKAAGGVDGVLNVTMKVDHTTTTGVVHQAGRFIIGQIHDQDDEPIRLYYRKLPSRDTGTVYFAHENTLEGTDDYHDLIGGLDGITDDGIALGEVFSYQIKVVANELTVTVSREGKPDVVKVVDMSESGYDKGGKYMYFKWGAYNQNNTGNPDDYVQATFYKVTATHDAPMK